METKLSLCPDNDGAVSLTAKLLFTLTQNIWIQAEVIFYFSMNHFQLLEVQNCFRILNGDLRRSGLAVSGCIQCIPTARTDINILQYTERMAQDERRS